MAQTAPFLAGQKVLVTGAGRGIGRSIAQILAREGAHVAICSRTKSELEETANTVSDATATTIGKTKTNPHDMELYTVDLTNEDQVDQMVKSLAKKWGKIDILINNAGKGQPSKGPVSTLKTQDLQHLLDLNVLSVHSVTSAVLRHSMLKDEVDKNNENETCNDGNDKKWRGRIINVSSRAAKVGYPNMSFYVTSKFALEGYSSSLSKELKEHNISVNTISPGMVDTQSFPKQKGRKGVRSADSVRDGLMVLLEHGYGDDSGGDSVTGHYLHVDELDLVREKGLEDSLALKSIDESLFSV